MEWVEVDQWVECQEVLTGHQAWGEGYYVEYCHVGWILGEVIIFSSVRNQIKFFLQFWLSGVVHQEAALGEEDLWITTIQVKRELRFVLKKIHKSYRFVQKNYLQFAPFLFETYYGKYIYLLILII